MSRTVRRNGDIPSSNISSTRVRKIFCKNLKFYKGPTRVVNIQTSSGKTFVKRVNCSTFSK